MARNKRIRSSTDVYHVVSRGNNKSDILLNDSDKKYFRVLMKKEADKLGVNIYAYCIMTNHDHIMLKSDLKVISLFMKELNFKYAIYYNCKYGQSGHVFQGRFFSSPIETEGYLLSCIRYIHNNPVRAHIVSEIMNYPFSSAGEYIAQMAGTKQTNGYISKDIFNILYSRFKKVEDFLEFHNIFDNQEFLDIIEEKSEYDFQRVKYQLKIYMNTKKIKSYKILANVPHIRNEFVKICKQQTGLAERKIENILKILAESA